MHKKIVANPILLTISLLAVALVIIFIIFAMTSQPDLNDGSKVTVRVDQQRITATVAATEESQATGLGDTRPIDDKQGLLFVYDQPVTPTFYMKGMTYPIDIIWINDDTVTDVTPDVQPEPGVAEDQLKKYLPPGPVNKVLEVNAGFASRHGIQPGDPIRISSF